MTSTHPDISHVMKIVRRYLSDLQHHHLTVAFCYIRGTLGRGMFFPSTSSLELVGYADANYAGCLDPRRSTTGWCMYFGNSLVSRQWKTRSGLHIFNGGWISSHVFRMLWNHLVDFSKRSLLYSVLEDNKNAIQIALNLVYHECTKYNDVVCHFISGKALIKSFFFSLCFIISLNYEHPY